jgi:succinate dehydrogenase flavin-adding protein (antitoxin of CptAB toxin-antitoxin module)
MLRSLSRRVGRVIQRTYSQPNPAAPSDISTKHLAPELRRKRLLLNSRNRGRLETELFFGGYANDKLHQMNEQQLDEYEIILNETDADLYNWVRNIHVVLTY